MKKQSELTKQALSSGKFSAVCRKCNNVITDPTKWNFHFNGCKECRQAYLRERYATNPSYRIKNKERYRAKVDKYKFASKNLKVPDNWDEYPKDKCEICEKPITPKTMRIDHSHQTGKFRGVLCTSCNTGIGLLGDEAEKFQKVLKYMNR